MQSDVSLKTKNLLLICHSYQSFQKDSIEATAPYLRSVSTLVRVNPLVEYTRFLPFLNFSQNRIEYKIDTAAIPLNCKIFPTPISYFPIERHYRVMGEKHFQSLQKIIREKKVEFDLIHSHFTWSAGYVGARLKEKTEVPFVVTAHGYDIYSLPFKNDFWREKIRYVLNTADHIITVSESNRACIEKLEISTPFSVIPNGYSADLFFPRDTMQCRRELNLPLDKRIIMTAGNFVPVKGHAYLIAAMQEICRTRDYIICIIIGSGPLEHELKQMVKQMNLNDHVLFPGRKSHAELATWMNACDIFVLPSLRESFGVVQIEAMACGKPVVATRNGGSEEIIISGKHGILVKQEDSGDLMRGILQGLERKWHTGTIIEYVQKYSWKTLGGEIRDIYKLILEV